MIAIGTVGLAVASSLMLGTAASSSEATRASVKVKLANADERVHVIQVEDGTHRFVLHSSEGSVELTPDRFAARVYAEQANRPFWMLVLNITSYAGITWVVLGFAGQALFTGRMVVQWLTSEKHRRSVVPTVFWWMSLGGSTMLMVYFVWRKDIVAVLGQSTGWFIYLRNLYLIYSRRSGSKESEASDA
ncbi:MAG: lipid-A-disaccharide synthase N-terminal domain-containing protein [Desulfobacterales bacterium]|nr:lipid-A-disaccharide synthase N-terminal domain-containing protein [Desulfobacterales bacterium]